MTFSLCMIVKNEENFLGRCLDSVKDVFDEIIIADTGSIDSTVKIASQYTDKIYEYKWCDDFAAARNFSFSKATGDYIMWLDADDILTEDDRLAIIELKKEITFETNVVMMKYAVSFAPDGSPLFYYYRERLVKRAAHLKWNGFVHEAITPSGKVIYSDITICHKPGENKAKDPARNLKIYEANLAKGILLSARETYYYGRELYYNGKYDRAAIQLERFLTMPKGWHADKTGACIILYEIYNSSNLAKARSYLALALSYESLNPQIICFMGDSYQNSGNYELAAFWYKAALMCPSSYKQSGFVITEYERYYPLLQLCLCSHAMGDNENAREYNRLAGLERPDCERVKHNEEFFAEILDKTEIKSEEI